MDHERKLVDRIREGDAKAFRELVEEHKENVYHLALDLCGNHYDAEDISQDVFVKAYRNVASFRGGARLGTWLYRITMNTYLDRKRRKSLNLVSLTPAGEDGAAESLNVPAPEVAGDPGRALDAARVGTDIEKALGALSEKERAVFVMRHYHDLQIKEISVALEVAEGTVKSLLFRSMRKLREELSFYRGDLGMEELP